MPQRLRAHHFVISRLSYDSVARMEKATPPISASLMALAPPKPRTSSIVHPCGGTVLQDSLPRPLQKKELLKQRRPDSDQGRSLFDRDLKIAAHAHRKIVHLHILRQPTGGGLFGERA